MIIIVILVITTVLIIGILIEKKIVGWASLAKVQAQSASIEVKSVK